LKIETAGGSEITPTLHKGIVDRINKFSPDLLFVAFGNPKQEIFVAENAKSQMLNVKCFMSVGGTFRYIAGLSHFLQNGCQIWDLSGSGGFLPSLIVWVAFGMR